MRSDSDRSSSDAQTAGAPSGIRTGEAGPLLKLIKDQRVAFLLVGGTNTVYSTILYIVFELALGPRVPSFVALFLAWIISLLTVFFVYRKLVFKVSGHVLRDLFRFALVNLSVLVINTVLLSIASEGLHLPRIPSQLVITCFTVGLSYVGHLRFSFHRSPSELES